MSGIHLHMPDLTTGPVTPENACYRITAGLLELAQLMASFPAETKLVDPRAWGALLVYSPFRPERAL